MSTTGRPNLRIVKDGETASPSSVVSTPPQPAATLRGPERLEFETVIGHLPLDRLDVAARAVLAGKTLVSGALDIRHRAVSHAPSAFHRGITPGEKSAEAAHALLESLGADLAKGVCDAETVKFAAVDAASELDRAADVADKAGLPVEDDRSKLFRHATQFVRSSMQPVQPTVAKPAPQHRVAQQMALLALGAADEAAKPSKPMSPVAVGIIGGVVGGVIVALLLA